MRSSVIGLAYSVAKVPNELPNLSTKSRHFRYFFGVFMNFFLKKSAGHLEIEDTTRRTSKTVGLEHGGLEIPLHRFPSQARVDVG